MKKELVGYTQTLYNDGPWSLKEFNDYINKIFKEIKKASKEKFTKFTFDLDTEYDYGHYGDNNTSKNLRIICYRLENDNEYSIRLQAEKNYEERQKKYKEAAKKKSDKAKEKKRQLEENPEYQEYKKLQAKLKKEKVI